MNIRDYLNNISPEERQRISDEQLKENQDMYKDFQDAYKKGCCSLCGNKLDYFNIHEKCFHWFTLPRGIKKKDFIEYLREPIGFFRLESYFRWMASLTAPLKNINDLSDNISTSKIKEITIRFKSIEWSLNYGQGELSGHKNSKNANFPHFHIQLLKDGKPFIRFNDFHIPFSEEDLFDIKLINENSDLIYFRHTHGEGMSFIEDQENLNELAKIMRVADDENTATFKTSSMIQMPEGKTMSGEVLDRIFKESRSTKIPIRVLLKKYYPEATIVTEVNPGKGVPNMKKRNKR